MRDCGGRRRTNRALQRAARAYQAERSCSYTQALRAVQQSVAPSRPLTWLERYLVYEVGIPERWLCDSRFVGAYLGRYETARCIADFEGLDSLYQAKLRKELAAHA